MSETWPHAGRIRAHQENSRARPELHRARNLLGDVERALLLQKFAARAEKISDNRAEHPGQSGRGKCRRGRYRRRLGDRVQDREPQSPERDRAVSRRGHRRRRDHSRYFHDGRAPGVSPQFAALRSDHLWRIRNRNRQIRSRRTGGFLPASSPASRTTEIASAFRRSAAKFISTKASRAIRW